MESLPPGWLLASVTRDGVELTDSALDASAGRTLAGVELLVTSRAASPAGRVIDTTRRPVAGGAAVVFAADAARWTYPSRFVRSAPIQADGTFRATGLPSGEFLVARVGTLANGWDAPSSLEVLRAGATPVRLAAGTPSVVTVMSAR
jgi:hypothetical protein